MDAMHGAARMGAAAGASAGVTMRRPPVGRVGAESAREEKAVHASLNMRRKFFHALAVLMFVPGIAVDVRPPLAPSLPFPVAVDADSLSPSRSQPAFTSLAFSVAFSLFTFAEYARYFALYPIGGPLHIFFSEFVDSKDGGPVILSHFYLLTGCAGGLWLEGRGINRYTGVLVLGVGDSLVRPSSLSLSSSSAVSQVVELPLTRLSGATGLDRRQARRAHALAGNDQDARGHGRLHHVGRPVRLAPAPHRRRRALLGASSLSLSLSLPLCSSTVSSERA